MVLNIPISDALEAQLRTLATAAGIDLTTFAARPLERAGSQPPLEVLLAPLRAEFETGGTSEEQLTELLERAKHETRTARRIKRNA